MHAVITVVMLKTLTSHVDTYTFLLRRSEHSQLRSRDVDRNGSTALRSM